MDEDRFNMSVRKFLKHVGVTSQREIERVVREGAVDGPVLKVRMTLTAENASLEHVIEEDIQLVEQRRGAAEEGKDFTDKDPYRIR
jgi:16S rRNA U516 pseudouridylate synthase RsuA-like enzyme